MIDRAECDRQRPALCSRLVLHATARNARWLSVAIVVVALSASAREDIGTQDARMIEAADNLDIMIASEPDSPVMQAVRQLMATDPAALVIMLQQVATTLDRAKGAAATAIEAQLQRPCPEPRFYLLSRSDTQVAFVQCADGGRYVIDRGKAAALQ